jgi:hypothetical protein
LKGEQNLALTGIRSPDRLASSESLYRLSYPGPHTYIELGKGNIYRIRYRHTYIELGKGNIYRIRYRHTYIELGKGTHV